MRKEIRLYDVIFPIWMIWLFPPVVFFALAGNLVVDSILFFILCSAFKVASATGMRSPALYRKTITYIWLLGFAADFIGAVPLFVIFGMGIFPVELPWQVSQAVFMNPFHHIAAFFAVFACVLLAGVFIFIFNYRFTFKKLIVQQSLRFKMALCFAVITAPWTFLIPSTWWSTQKL